MKKKLLIVATVCASLFVVAPAVSVSAAEVESESQVQTMIADGADDFTECGPGKALQGMIGRIDKNVAAHGIA